MMILILQTTTNGVTCLKRKEKKKKNLKGNTCFRLEEERDFDFFSFYIDNYCVSEYLKKIEKKEGKKYFKSYTILEE